MHAERRADGFHKAGRQLPRQRLGQRGEELGVVVPRRLPGQRVERGGELVAPVVFELEHGGIHPKRLPLFRREVVAQAQRTFHGDLGVAEVGRVENLADLDFLEGLVDAEDAGGLVLTDFNTLRAKVYS